LLCESGVSGQSGSSLPAAQSAAVVRPPRASATVTDEITATAANTAVSLRMDFSNCSAHQHGVTSMAGRVRKAGLKTKYMADLEMNQEQKIILENRIHVGVDPVLEVGLYRQPPVDRCSIG
jgi:hypothetical protein